MYYNRSIDDLVEPISTEGPWSLREKEKADVPVIPCLSCHPIHMENEPLEHPASMDDPAGIFYERGERQMLTGFYLRSDKMHLRADQLRGDRKAVGRFIRVLEFRFTDDLQEGLWIEGWKFLADFYPALFRQRAAERWRRPSKLPTASHRSSVAA